mgnify:CR=1 FL=1
MRHLLACLLTAASVSASAEEPVRAPANVAYELFVGCVRATVGTAREIEPTRVGIHDFVEEVDDTCLMWTVIWFPTFYSGVELADYPGGVAQRFNARRLQVLQQLTNELRAQAQLSR